RSASRVAGSPYSPASARGTHRVKTPARDSARTRSIGRRRSRSMRSDCASMPGASARTAWITVRAPSPRGRVRRPRQGELRERARTAWSRAGEPAQLEVEHDRHVQRRVSQAGVPRGAARSKAAARDATRGPVLGRQRMVQSSAATATTCAEAAVAAGREIRALVHGMDPQDRAQHRTPFLKPRGGYGARHVDAVAEEAGLAHLERLARELGCANELLVDPAAAVMHRVGRGSHTIWASMDAIDGTVKVAGLGERHADRVRLANDGGWAAGFAFTAPTERGLPELTFGDFDVAVVVDGNPTRHRAYPQDLVTLPSPGGLGTWEVTERPCRRGVTTTGADLC